MGGLYTNSDISVESWVELNESVSMNYEVDREEGSVTLFFGVRNDFVLHLSRGNLAQVVELGTRALAELPGSAG